MYIYIYGKCCQATESTIDWIWFIENAGEGGEALGVGVAGKLGVDSSGIAPLSSS